MSTAPLLPLRWWCQHVGVRRTVEVNEGNDDLQEITDAALREMAAEEGDGFDPYMRPHGVLQEDKAHLLR